MATSFHPIIAAENLGKSLSGAQRNSPGERLRRDSNGKNRNYTSRIWGHLAVSFRHLMIIAEL